MRSRKRAVELDDGESTCHSLLAQVCLQRRAYEMAIQHMQRAVEINPTNQWNQADMGLVLTYVGKAQEALAWYARARQIDPYFDPPWYWRQTGQTYMALGRYQEAVSMFAHIPVHTYRTAALMAGCHARLGDMESARKWRRGMPVHDAGLLGPVVHVEGTVPVPRRRRAAGRVPAPRRPAGLTAHGDKHRESASREQR